MFRLVVITVILAFFLVVIMKVVSLTLKRLSNTDASYVSLPCMSYNAQSASAQMTRVAEEHSNRNSPVRDTEEFIECPLKHIDADEKKIENRIIKICCGRTL